MKNSTRFVNMDIVTSDSERTFTGESRVLETLEYLDLTLRSVECSSLVNEFISIETRFEGTYTIDLDVELNDTVSFELTIKRPDDAILRIDGHAAEFLQQLDDNSDHVSAATATLDAASTTMFNSIIESAKNLAEIQVPNDDIDAIVIAVNDNVETRNEIISKMYKYRQPISSYRPGPDLDSMIQMLEDIHSYVYDNEDVYYTVYVSAGKGHILTIDSHNDQIDISFKTGDVHDHVKLLRTRGEETNYNVLCKSPEAVQVMTRIRRTLPGIDELLSYIR